MLPGKVAAKGRPAVKTGIIPYDRAQSAATAAVNLGEMPESEFRRGFSRRISAGVGLFVLF